MNSWRLLCVLFVVSLTAGCQDPGVRDDCTPGELGCDCDAGSCNEGSCVEDLCVICPAGSQDCPCDGTSCTGNLECIDGTCRGATDICSATVPCASGQRCIDGSCFPCTIGSNGCTCDSGDTCDTGLSCSDGVCVPDTCGDSAVDIGEECDDGDLDDDDGCSSICTVETGWECSGDPSVCTCVTGCETPDPSLLIHYTFDDISGSTVTNAVGDAHHGTNYEAVQAEGIHGQAFAFDGQNDYVDMHNYDLPTAAFTITTWIRPENLSQSCNATDLATQGRIFSKAVGTAEQDHYVMLGNWCQDGIKLRFRLRTNGTTDTLIAPTNNVLQGEWTHVAAVYDGSEMMIYKDGVKIAGAAKTGAVDTSATVNSWIGDNPPLRGDRPWDGRIDDFRIYDRALEAAELLALHEAGGGGTVVEECEPVAGEFLIHDEVVTYTDTDCGFMFWYGHEGYPANWHSPHDYYNGTIHTRYQVISQPTDEPLRMDFIMWKEVGQELAGTRWQLDGGAGSLAEEEQILSDFWVVGDGIDLHDSSNIWRVGVGVSDAVDHVSCPGWGYPQDRWDTRGNWYPLNVRITVVAVAAGAEFSGWDCWASGSTPGGNDTYAFNHSQINDGLAEYGQTGSPTLEDYNDDGFLDFTISDGLYPNAIYWLEGRASGAWTQHEAGSLKINDTNINSLGATSFDVDHNGYPDIVAGGTWHANNGDGTFTSHVFDPLLDVAIHDVAFGDFNNDGDRDVAMMGENYGFYWYDIPANPTNTWTRSSSIGSVVHGGFSPAGIGDLDGDGDDDIVRASAWFENTGNGASWSEHSFGATNFANVQGTYGISSRSFIIDIDQDGDNDVVMTECDGVGLSDTSHSAQAGIFYNNGDGSSWNLVRLPQDGDWQRNSLHSLRVVDFNLDGRLDIVSVEQEDIMIPVGNYVSPKWYLWENTSGSWREQIILDNGRGGHDIVAKDVDQDGDVDIVSKVWHPWSGNANGGEAHADYMENRTVVQPSAGIRLSSNVSSGWHPISGNGAVWTTVGGTIRGEQGSGGEGGLLISDQTFDDFEIVFDVWPDYNIDTGIYLRCSETGQAYQVTIDYQPDNPMGSVWLSGIGDTGESDFVIANEYEISGTPSFDIDAWSYIWKVREWNQFRVRIEGSPPTITTWINGFVVNEFTDTTTRRSDGSIGLQVHDAVGNSAELWPAGARVLFRNIKIYPIE